MKADNGSNDPQPTGPAPWEIRSWWGRLLVGRKPVRTLVRIILLVVVTLGGTKWCLTPMRVTGHSMEPTYRNGRYNALNLLAYRAADPRRGDVVGIQLRGHRMVLLKRVLGLPGERIQVRNGMVLLNGVSLDEPYARGSKVPPTDSEVTLGPGQYFVIGDNRDVSQYGVVDRSEIKGKVLF